MSIIRGIHPSVPPKQHTHTHPHTYMRTCIYTHLRAHTHTHYKYCSNVKYGPTSKTKTGEVKVPRVAYGNVRSCAGNTLMCMHAANQSCPYTHTCTVHTPSSEAQSNTNTLPTADNNVS